MINDNLAKTGIGSGVIEEIRDIARYTKVDKVILFGSRARGDYKERSDIDLACSGCNVAQFILDVEENTSTLLKFDIVNLDSSVKAELLESIKREGILIYEKI